MLSNKTPRVSVIMPAYNASLYIREAINGVLNQTFTNFEFIIADDGSTDDTKRIIDSYKDPRIIISHNPVNQGKTKTVNKLFKEAKGEFVTVHDADDVSHPDRFRMQVEAMQKDPNLVLCGTSFYTVNKAGFILEQNEMPETYEEIMKGIDRQSQFHGPTMMIRHSVLKNAEEFYRPYFRDNYEDTDLAYRIVEKGKSINLKPYLYVYRILDTSLCRADVNIRNRNLYHVVSYLGQQRKQKGADVIMENKPELADAYLDQITVKYQHDPALIYREAASYYFYWKLHQKALQSAWTGFITRPFQLINLRTYLYIIRQQIFNFFKFDKRNKKHYQKVFS
jgi:glycosyltransferase involved in cell wall biosynthesis